MNKWNVLCHNGTPAVLVEYALKRGEGRLSNQGAFVVETGKYTGRSPNDKFIVKDAQTQDSVWWGPSNHPMTTECARELHERIETYLKGREVFIQDSYAGTHPKHRMSIRVITEKAWNALFAQNMFVDASETELEQFEPDFTVYHAPGFKADPTRDGTRSEVAVVINFDRKHVLICGTEYAGEIKKSIFSVLNYLLPAEGILGMHCSANVGDKGDVAIFFGLSGTGKTTLSADPRRQLIGDDEHGWCDDGVFNFEGGCYAKVIRLSAQDEPEIFQTTQTFGTVLENVVMDEEKRELDLNSAALTENTRASYPISQISNAHLKGYDGHPRHVVMLTCDAFGVLPPLSKLTTEQAMYHFVNGYTARVAGTERGVTEPKAVFSACFGAPFMPRPPREYAKLLGERINSNSVDCWLVNTGWTGGPYGVGNRMKIKWTRALLDAALSGSLSHVQFVQHPIFHVSIPVEVAGVPTDVLDPRRAWQDPKAYDEQARRLVQLFEENMK